MSVAAALTGVATAPANAAEPRVTTAADGSVAIDIPSGATAGHEVDANQLALVDTAVDESSKTFDYKKALAAGADAQFAAEYALGYSASGGTVLNAPAGAHAAKNLVSPMAKCKGQNKIWSDWIGFHYRLDSCLVQRVIALEAEGAGAAAIAGAIGGAVSAGGTALAGAVAGALLAMGSAGLAACAVNGTGVEGVGTGVICWAQQIERKPQNEATIQEVLPPEELAQRRLRLCCRRGTGNRCDESDHRCGSLGSEPAGSSGTDCN